MLSRVAKFTNGLLGKVSSQKFQLGRTPTLSATISQQPAFFRDGIYKNEFEAMPIINEDICSFLFSRWSKWTNREAVVCAATDRKITYGQLLDASLRFGGALKSLNLKSSHDVVTVTCRGTVRIPQRISVLSPNVLEYVPVVFGTLAAGFSLTTINCHYKIAEICHSLKDTTPEILVVHSSLEDLADEALSYLKMDIPVVTIGQSNRGRPNIQDIIKDNRIEKITPIKVDPSDIALILHSGGTTGLPKGVAINHSGVVNNLLWYTNPKLFPIGLGEEPTPAVMGLVPFYHIFGLYVIMLTSLSLGVKIVSCQEFDPNQFGKLINKHQISNLHLVPTLLNFAINSPLVTAEDLSCVRGALIAAAPVLPSSVYAFQEKLSRTLRFQEGYGMTEILCATLTPVESVRIGCCGKLISNTEAKIVDPETNKILGLGQPGHLLIRSPAIMSHYLNNPIATDETIDDEGFLATGDIATCDENGYFSIIDRMKDLIKVKDFQVSPAEIENVLMKHPAVAEAGVVGVPDERLGERPRAYVSLKGKVTEQELIKLVEENLASYKNLTGGVVFLDDLPKNQAGKILRKELRGLVK